MGCSGQLKISDRLGLPNTWSRIYSEVVSWTFSERDGAIRLSISRLLGPFVKAAVSQEVCSALKLCSLSKVLVRLVDIVKDGWCLKRFLV